MATPRSALITIRARARAAPRGGRRRLRIPDEPFTSSSWPEEWPETKTTDVEDPDPGDRSARARGADTWGTIEAVHAEGLTRHVGVSNFSAKKAKELLSHAKVKPEVNQIELHLFLQQKALLDYCATQRIHVTGYSPLGSGDTWQARSFVDSFAD